MLHVNPLACNISYDAVTSFSLRKVVQMKLGGLLKEFEVVSSGASREYSLERSLANMREIWSTTTLAMAPHPFVLT